MSKESAQKHRNNGNGTTNNNNGTAGRRQQRLNLSKAKAKKDIVKTDETGVSAGKCMALCNDDADAHDCT
ncbi:hypothetical protein PsorP6_010566 [Peronosclerospora sorghi]|uniref:Uncharacterized protein n=1 Tax=Peronosclerospora sorghi TaxID=230839 RepID=A0ACC0VWT6_9STRA|nr:hypothetical protein PsorP6_010566 [Peronosclerospora sorghi]